MVAAVHFDSMLFPQAFPISKKTSQKRPWLHEHIVSQALFGAVLERTSAFAGNILYERPPGGDVQELDTPTDAENWYAIPQCPPCEGQLHLIALPINKSEFARIRNTVMLGSYITATTQKQAVEQAVELLQRALTGEQW